MTAMKPITIVGGGLAGLTLGIGLRRNGVPVTLWEAGRYPRHRVCGEFISGRGQETLARFDLLEPLHRAGARGADTAAFFSANCSTGPRPLPARAIGLSRFTLDASLANQFRELGGDLQEGVRRTESVAEGMVRATGRHAPPVVHGPCWFGLKAHARNVPLSADLEMHVFSGGYVGLCRVDGGRVNVCGLFRRRTGEKKPPSDWRERLRGPAGSVLRQRLDGAEFDLNSFCAVAGLSLQPHRAIDRAECCIGDAITMIPPVTGNGMSMAFESAELAIGPLVAWSRGDVPWDETRQQIAGDCDAAFARRLAWAKWFQRLLLTPPLQAALVRLAARSRCFWQTAFEKTR